MLSTKKECVAMLLAGGQGTRLGVLTKNVAKPAVPFGGKYRIIDFPISNTINSGIDTIGVLTQYQPFELNQYIGNGQPWDLDRLNGGAFVLPPYQRGKSGEWYKGTANAIYQNINFIDRYDPEYVLILSGDHIYKMDYAEMLAAHKKNKADCTIAVLEVSLEEASRFGIMNTNPDGSVYEFEEKPKHPKSNKASMGIYIFNWKILRPYLVNDEQDKESSHDFGKNIIPNLLNAGANLYAYGFTGYWKDVGTIGSLWEANMDLLGAKPEFKLSDKDWRIYSKSPAMPPHYIGSEAEVRNSLVSEGCVVYGNVEKSVLFTGVHVGANAVIRDSIVMPNAVIGENVTVEKAIIGEGACVENGAHIGAERLESDGDYDTKLTGDITLVANTVTVPEGRRIPVGMIVK